MEKCHVHWRLAAILTLILTNSCFTVALEDMEKQDVSRSSRLSVIRRALPPLPSLDDPPGPSYPPDDKMSVQIPPNGLMNDEGTPQQQSDQSQMDENLEEYRSVANNGYLAGKIKISVDKAHLFAFSKCIKPAAQAGLADITEVAPKDIRIGDRLFEKQSTAKAVQKEIMVTFNLTTTEANKANLANVLAHDDTPEDLEKQINKDCNPNKMVSGGGSTAFTCRVESVELDGVATTTTTTKQGYLAVGGPNFVVNGNIQLKFRPWNKARMEALKAPVCHGIAYSTGQPPQACKVIGSEVEHNKGEPNDEVEINFAFNLTILDHDYSKVAKSIDWYVHDDITNVVRWECQHDNISAEAKAGTLAVNVVEYSRANQGKSRASYIGVLGELIVSLPLLEAGSGGTELVIGTEGDRWYLKSAFIDAVMASLPTNKLDATKFDTRLSQAAGGNFNFTFQYLDLEANVDNDARVIGKLMKDKFDAALVDFNNQIASANEQVASAAIRSGFVKKITGDDPRLPRSKDAGSPPPCQKYSKDADTGEEKRIRGKYYVYTDAPEDFQDDEKMQFELKLAFAKYTCSSVDEMNIKVERTEPPFIRTPDAPINEKLNPPSAEKLLLERDLSRAKTKAILRRVGPNDEHVMSTPGQTLAKITVTINAFAMQSKANRVHFMMKHLPLDGFGEYLMKRARELRIEEKKKGKPDLKVEVKAAVKLLDVKAPESIANKTM